MSESDYERRGAELDYLESLDVDYLEHVEEQSNLRTQYPHLSPAVLPRESDESHGERQRHEPERDSRAADL